MDHEDGEGGPPGSDAEGRDDSELGRPSARQIHRVIRHEGEWELRRPASTLAWSGLAAGLSMGGSLLASGLLRAHLPDAGWSPLVSKLGYSVGFLIVVLGRQQLFTESTLTAVLPLLYDRSARTLVATLRLWGIVLAANLVGVLFFAWAASIDGVFASEARAAFVAIGAEELEGTTRSTFVGAVFAGWLIALMVWLQPGADSFRAGAIVVLTYLIGVGGLPHVVAGSIGVMVAVLEGAVPWGDVLGRFLLPTLAGNTLGGVVLVAMLNHGQADGENDTTGGPPGGA